MADGHKKGWSTFGPMWTTVKSNGKTILWLLAQVLIRVLGKNLIDWLIG